VSVRLALAAVSIVTTAWLAVALRNAAWTSQSEIEVLRAAEHLRVARKSPLGHGSDDISGALTRLKAAQFLNPDRSATLYEATALAAIGDRPAAVRRLKKFTTSFPDDPLGWIILARLPGRSDPGATASARARLRVLDPLGSP
jgi:hypothetical protein